MLSAYIMSLFSGVDFKTRRTEYVSKIASTAQNDIM